MTQHSVVLTEQEKGYLLDLLERALKETRVEAHHTHTPGYREQVLQEEDLVRALLAKLRSPA
jgi:hypothetical protein